MPHSTLQSPETELKSPKKHANLGKNIPKQAENN